MGVAVGEVACLRGAIKSKNELSGKFAMKIWHDADDFTIIVFQRLEV